MLGYREGPRMRRPITQKRRHGENVAALCDFTRA
jgi:hypothetical protein